MTIPLGSYNLDMVQEFYASYRAITVLPIHKYLVLVRFMRNLQLEHTMVRGVRVDSFIETIHIVIVCPDYISPTSIF